MKRNLFSAIISMLLFILGGLVLPGTASAKSDPLVSTDWLAGNLKTKNLVIIDVRTETNYGVGHIPGSVNVPYSEWEPYDEDRECNLMPIPEDFTELMQDAGINQATHVVIYDHGNSISDASKGAACVWVLQTMGHANVSYLDGGFTKWTFEGRIIDNVEPTPPLGNFKAAFDMAKVSSLGEVIAKVKSKDAVFVDARTAAQHFGVEKRADVERFGHIAGSVSLPASYLTNAGINRAPATIKSRAVLEEMAASVGIPADKNTELIVYCNSGQFAGLDYLVLHDILGYANVSVYDGSMTECGASEEIPVVKFAWGHVTR